MSDPTKPLPHAVTGLIEKRREIAGQIEDLQRQMREAVCNLDHVEAAIRLFKPDIDLDEIMPRPDEAGDQGVTANTVPTSEAPPPAVVPYNVPFTSIRAAEGSHPSVQFFLLQKEYATVSFPVLGSSANTVPPR